MGIHGILTALITPFKDDAVDYDRLTKMISWQLSEGVHGLVVGSVTGEGNTLSEVEWGQTVETAVQAANKRVPILAFIMTQRVEDAENRLKQAATLGVDGVLLAPYFFSPPGDEGQLAYIRNLMAISQVPLYLYNNPMLFGVDIDARLLTALMLDAEKPLAGMVDASGDMARIPFLRDAGGADFWLLSGDDTTSLAACAMGAVGVMSITANIAPNPMAEFFELLKKDDFSTALKYHDTLTSLHWVLRAETDPMPAKFAADLLGICDASCRSPLGGLSKGTKALIAGAITQTGLDPVMFDVD